MALVSKIIGDTAAVGLYATEAESEAASALVAAANASREKLYGFRGEARDLVLFSTVGMLLGVGRTVRLRQVLVGKESGLVSSAFEQYKSVRSAAMTLGGNVQKEIPDIQSASTEYWSERKKQAAWKWAKTQAKDALQSGNLPEGKRDE